MRPIPIGYSYLSIEQSATGYFRDYLGCGNDSSSTVDFFGFSVNRFCDESDLSDSKFDIFRNTSLDSPVPQFFSEIECVNSDRTFSDQNAILGLPMKNTCSGSVVCVPNSLVLQPVLMFVSYNWGELSDNFGIASYNHEGTSSVSGGLGTPIPMSSVFYNLKRQVIPLSLMVETNNYQPLGDLDPSWSCKLLVHCQGHRSCLSIIYS